MMLLVLDNLVTDRPDNAPPLAGKAFHGVSLMLAAMARVFQSQ